MWRREVQARGSEHYHCLTTGLSAEDIRIHWLQSLHPVHLPTLTEWTGAPAIGSIPRDSSPCTDAGGIYGRCYANAKGTLVTWPGGSKLLYDTYLSPGPEPDSHLLYYPIHFDGYYRIRIDAPHALPPADWPQQYTGIALREYSPVAIPGAARQAFRAETWDGSIGWHRYMCAHATKHKDEQAAQRGRAWGIICRQLVEPITPELLDLPPQSLYAVRRIMRRLQSPRRHMPDGTRKLYMIPPHNMNTRTSLVAPETLTRILEWAHKHKEP